MAIKSVVNSFHLSIYPPSITVHADGVNAEWFYPLYTKINSMNNSVASAQLLILLKRHEPNTTLVRAVMSRPLNNDDHFTTSAIKVSI